MSRQMVQSVSEFGRSILHIAPQVLCVLGVTCFLVCIGTDAFAGGTGGGPWEDALDALVGSFSGTTAQLIVTMLIIFTGLAWIAGMERGVVALLAIAIGGAIAMGAAEAVAFLFGGAAAVV